MKNLKSTLAPALAAGLAVAALVSSPSAFAAPITDIVKAGASSSVSPLITEIQARNQAEAAIRAKAALLSFPFLSPHPGNAVSGLEVVKNGYRIRYQNCDIYYSKDTGAHEVHGAIRDKYNAKGGPNSDLFLPTTDETGTPDGIGRYNHFSGNGSIYWTPDTGPFEVRGGIRGFWANQGWERGALGYPTTDERVIGDSQWVSDFQNGVVYWDKNGYQAPLTAGLSRDRLAAAVRRLFEANKGNGDVHVGSVGVSDVTNTGYDFWASRNRLVTFHFHGWHDNGLLPDTDFDMDLRLLFYANKDYANGRETGGMHLFVALDHWHIHTSGLGNGKLFDGLKDGVLKLFAKPMSLGDIPADAEALSFKVMKDGALNIYLKPDIRGGLNLGGLHRYLIQQKLDQFVDG